MTGYLAALAFTYLCNSTAEVRLVSPDEARACTSAYELVKRHFYPSFEVAAIGTPERQAQNAAAYLAFKRWETDNATLVAQMQATARRQARDATALAANLD